MRWSGVLRQFLLISTVVMVPVLGHAQEAVLSGTVTDSTGGVLAGVTLTAVNEANGNTFAGVTDERGVYRLAARAGVYRLTAELQGFRAVSREGLQLLVGEVVTVNLPMLEATAAETITVSATASLVDISTSSLGGNVDPRQVQELPVAGRNWMGLALLAPGSRTSSTNAIAPLPDRNNGEAREFQLNLDGQQVSSELGAGNQPRYSQDSIAEFQFVSNRFDATQGRSSGVQVNAITRSGSNRLSGLFRSNFRDSSFNAQDPVLGRVVPIKNQQYSTTLGGPTHHRQAALLRELRIRAGAADEHLEHALPRLQHRVDRHEHAEARWHSSRLSAVAPDARDGKDVQAQELGALRPGHDQQSPGADGHDRRTQRGVHRPPDAGAEQSDAQRGQGWIQSLRIPERTADRVVETLAGASCHQRPPSHHAHGLFNCGQRQLSASSRPARVVPARRFHVLLRRARAS